uniref:Uncharacterized protein n=1 Tax=Candidatus Nitrotoga fabula TaxID=2182327 RepID=A0A2X0R7E8_9PROT|nr:protein of unknown function [Candidatus Nitrotoga fabula]
MQYCSLPNLLESTIDSKGQSQLKRWFKPCDQ